MSETRLQQGDFSIVASALGEWPTIPLPPADASTPAQRLLNAARSAAQDSNAVGVSDLGALVRHLLRAEAESSGANNGLTVPAAEPWPRGGQWSAFSLEASEQGSWQTVFGAPWNPEWLGSDGSDPGAAAYRGAQEIPLGDAPGPAADPFLTSMVGLTSYRSVGQREAVRAVLATPSSATIIGNLPTGTGKSLVAYAPALMPNARGTTIVVVPTTALALDQERAFGEIVRAGGDRRGFAAELAYHGDLSDGARTLIRQRIATGTQRIVFTSPEGLVQSLSSAVYQAAERGLIDAFVIDEAHIVSQWGAEFRPAFQSLAGTRTDLLRTAAAVGAPFRTILLSATLTEESLLTLQGLFGRPGPTEMISSVALRVEPSYWTSYFEDEEQRDARIEECIRHLPRPLVLYATRVIDAKRWFQRLRDSGFRRVMLIAGETKAEGRLQAIRRLREGSLDLVVATSAFGLGVDQPDMRAVVHACVPETIDRYYQEVGRGGRDGYPSVAVLAAVPRDRAIADQLSKRKLISLQRGFERWQWMQMSASDIENGRTRLPLAVSPPDISGDNAENRAWNMRTLLLMDRAGLVRLEAAPPPKRDPEETDDEWELRSDSAFEEYAMHAVVQVREGALADQVVWDAAVSEARVEAIGADRSARRRMDDALAPDAPLCSLFTDTYRLTRAIPGIPDGQIPVHVAPSCGGCPGCRAAGSSPRRFVPPTPLAARSTSHIWAQPLRPWFAGQSALVLLYPETDDGWIGRVIQALERLVRLGMWALWAPPQVLSDDGVRSLHRFAPGRAVFHLDRWDRLHAPLLPTALVYPPGRGVHRAALSGGGPARVVFAPDRTRDPRHTSAQIREYHPAVATIETLLERL